MSSVTARSRSDDGRRRRERDLLAKGLVNFDDQPLAEAVAVMNRYSTDQIVIGDTRVASLRVSGQFRAGDSQRFAETLAEMHGLRAIRRENRIELVRK